LPWRTRAAFLTRPPNAQIIPWWPRQTPSMGVLLPSLSIASRETPKSRSLSGVPGPGDMTMASYARRSISAVPIASLRTTSTSTPRPPRACAMLWTNES